MKRLALLLLVLPAVVFATPSGHRWFNLPVSYRVFSHSSINGISSFSTNVLPRVRNAFDTWIQPPGCSTLWTSSYAGAFSSPTGIAAVSGSDNFNNVLWLGGSSWRYGNSTLGLTTTTFYSGSGEIVDADMELNNNIVWSNSGAYDAQDMESVVLHEAGHFLGLDHTNTNTLAIMYPTINPGVIKRSLAPTDATDVCNVYPGTPGGQGSPCASDSVCTGGRVCRAPSGSTSKICTTDCTGGQVCPTGYTCQSADIGSACLVQVGAPDLCKFCTSGADCSTGDCVGDETHNWCTISCTSAASCGPGYICMTGGNGRSVCVPENNCTNQCTSNSQCAAGFDCIAGACEATGNVGDRCEIAVYCKPCGVCIGSSTAAFCRACCAGTGECNGCSTSACSTAYSCQSVGGTSDSVCIPTSGASACQSCSTSTPCAPGLNCVAGRCHSTCNPSNPGSCAACYNAGGGTGYCACSDEIALQGDACGLSSTLRACASGLACVGSSPARCRRKCTIGVADSCGASEVCQLVDGQAVCVPQTTPGTQCNACVNGACSQAGLTCFQGRCYQSCAIAAPDCSSCTEISSGVGVCTCEDQRAGLNQSCGVIPPYDVYSCQYGLSCIQGTCRQECNLNDPACAAGTTCQVYSGNTYCLPPGGVTPTDAGTSTPRPDAGNQTVTSPGCGCGTGASSVLPFAALLLLGAFRRRRLGQE